MEDEEKKRLVLDAGERVRRLREDQGLTKERLAETAGISTQYVSDIEQGRKCMSFTILVDIGRALNVSLDALATGRELHDPAVDRVVDRLMALNPLERDLAAKMILDAAQVVQAMGREE